MSNVVRIKDMLPYSVGEAFDSEACWNCSVSTKCEGGKFVSELEDVADDIPAIMESYKQAAEEAVVEEGTDGIVELAEEMVEIMKNAKIRRDETLEAGNVFLHAIIEAQNMQPGRVIHQDEIYQPAVEEFTEAPANVQALDLSAETLDQIAGSIIHYAGVGMCEAIEVERNS